MDMQNYKSVKFHRKKISNEKLSEIEKKQSATVFTPSKCNYIPTS